MTAYRIVKGVAPQFQIEHFLSVAKKVPVNSPGRPAIRHLDYFKSLVHRNVLYYLARYAKEIGVEVYKPLQATSHLLHYEVEDSIRWHVDYRPNATGLPPRKVSASLALNNSGHFFQLINEDGAKTIAQNAGDLILFPGWAAHRVASPLELGLYGEPDERWSFTMWLNGPDFK